MRRNLIFHAVLAVLLMSAISCSDNRLNLYNWSYYTPDSVIKKFEQENNVISGAARLELGVHFLVACKFVNNNADIVFLLKFLYYRIRSVIAPVVKVEAVVRT